MNLVNLFEENFRRWGVYDVLTFEGATWTSHDLLNQWSKFSGQLCELGIRPGDRVLVVLPNIPEIHTVFPAIWKVGAVVCPVHFTYSATEIAAIIQSISPSAIVTTKEKAEHLGEQVRTSIGYGRILTVDHKSQTGFSSLGGARRSVSSPLLETQSRLPTDPAEIIFSSGSSGAPKGIIQSHGGFVSLLEGCRKTEHARGSALRPFFTDEMTVTIDFSSYAHTGRMFFLIMGYTRKQKTVLLSKFDPLKVLQKIQEFGVTFFGGPPVVYEELCGSPEIANFDLSSVKVWCSFAAPMTESQLQRYQKILKSRVYSVYGLTESVALVACEPGGEDRKAGSVGLPVHGTELKILGEDGHELSVGETGELCVSRGANALGYLNMPEESAKTFRGNWVHTGDLAKVDASGCIYLIGRKSAMINQGGVKIIPGEVEAVLNQIAGIESTVVVGLPDDLLGSIVGAFVKMHDTSLLTPADILQRCREALADGKVPRKIYFLASFPRTKTNKVDITRLLEIAQEIELWHLQAAKFDPTGLSNQEIRDKFLKVASSVLDQVLEISGQSSVDADRQLAEMGISSLRAVEYSRALSSKLGIPLSSTLIFHFRTLRAIADHATSLVTGVSATHQDLTAGKTPDQLASEAVLDGAMTWRNRGKFIVGSRGGDKSAILVTGATGFFGSHLLAALLSGSERELICVVRAPGSQEALAKLVRQAHLYGLGSDEFRGRVTAVPGDVAEDRLGLSQKVFDDLARRVGTVYHSAALVNHLFSYEDLYHANVKGTQEMLRFLNSGREKVLNYASTTAVGVVSERATLDHNRLLTTGYGQSKWVAEKLITIARERGLKANIFRSGRLCWNIQTGAAHASQFEILLLKAIITLKLSPPADVLAQFIPNMAPVDFAARATVYLSETSDLTNETFHLISPVETDGAAMLNSARQYGYDIVEVEHDHWLSELSRREKEFTDGSATRLLGLLLNTTSHSASYQKRGGFDYTCIETTAALRDSGITFSEPWKHMRACLSYLERAGFLQAPARGKVG